MHQKHSRLFSYVATAATVAITAAMIAVGAPTASAANRAINVNAAISGFSVSTINVKAGETVDITIKNTDAAIPHDLTIAAASFKVEAAGGKTATKSLTAPTKAGSYPYICSVPGHSATMKGNLVVSAAGAAAAAPAAAAPTDQVKKVPAGGVQTGGGSTASGVTNGNLLTLGGGLLVAAMMSVLFGTRVARRD
jgi:plastocyanin